MKLIKITVKRASHAYCDNDFITYHQHQQEPVAMELEVGIVAEARTLALVRQSAVLLSWSDNKHPVNCA